jgi:hypothetical protein
VRTPLVFHEVDSSYPNDRHYELIGEAYVHGMMQSQTWNLIEDDECKVSAEELEHWQKTPGLEARSISSNQLSGAGNTMHDEYVCVLDILGKRPIIFV